MATKNQSNRLTNQHKDSIGVVGIFEMQNLMILP